MDVYQSARKHGIVDDDTRLYLGPARNATCSKRSRSYATTAPSTTSAVIRKALRRYLDVA